MAIFLKIAITELDRAPYDAPYRQREGCIAIRKE